MLPLYLFLIYSKVRWFWAVFGYGFVIACQSESQATDVGIVGNNNGQQSFPNNNICTCYKKKDF